MQRQSVILITEPERVQQRVDGQVTKIVGILCQGILPRNLTQGNSRTSEFPRTETSSASH